MTKEEIQQKISQMKEIVSKIKSNGEKNLSPQEIQIAKEYNIVQNIYEAQLESELSSRIDKMSPEELTTIFEKHKEKLVDAYSSIKNKQEDFEIHRKQIFDQHNITITSEEDLLEARKVIENKNNTLSIAELMCNDEYVSSVVATAKNGVKYNDPKYSQNILAALMNFQSMLSQLKQSLARENKQITQEQALELANKAFSSVLKNPEDIEKIQKKFYQDHTIEANVESVFRYGNYEDSKNYNTLASTRSEGVKGYSTFQREAYLKKLSETEMFKKSGYESIEKFGSNLSSSIISNSTNEKTITEIIPKLKESIDEKIKLYQSDPNRIKAIFKERLCSHRSVDINQIIENNRVSDILGISSPEEIPENFNLSELEPAVQKLRQASANLKYINSELDQLANFAKTQKPEYDAIKNKIQECVSKEKILTEELGELQKESEVIRVEKVGMFATSKKQHLENLNIINQKIESKKAEIAAVTSEKQTLVGQLNYKESQISAKVGEIRRYDAQGYTMDQDPYRQLPFILSSDKGIDAEVAEKKGTINYQNDLAKQNLYNQMIVQVEAFARKNQMDPERLKAACGITQQTKFSDIEQIKANLERLKVTLESIKNKGIVKGDAKQYLEQIINSPVQELDAASVEEEIGKSR